MIYANLPTPRRILFMTQYVTQPLSPGSYLKRGPSSCVSAESGQANIHLAVIASLLQHHVGTVEVHLAAFEALRPRTPKGVMFHAIEGRCMRDTEWPELLQKATSIGTGFLSSFTLAHGLMRSLVPYTPAEYVSTADSAYRIITDLNPDLVVVDTLIQQGIDAATRAEAKYCLLSPNTAKDVAGCELGFKGLTYPLIGIGYTYPIPWPFSALNTIATLHLALHINHFDPHTLSLNRARDSAGYLGPLPMPHPDPEVPVLCMTTPTPGLDYAMPIPPRVICCGPITQPMRLVRDTDPDLWRWLETPGRRTVLISLGTHFKLDQAQAEAVWAGVRAVLDAREDVQVLWKLCKRGEYALEGKEYGDRLRVVGWIKSEPVDLLRSGKVAAVVHHGGSNSYHEALAAGVPQIILSGWLDTHDFGARMEYVKVGKWANQRTASTFVAEDITTAFLDVIGRHQSDLPSEVFKRRARQCAEEIEGYYGTHGLLDEAKRGGMEKMKLEGRDLAAEWIRAYCEAGERSAWGSEDV